MIAPGSRRHCGLVLGLARGGAEVLTGQGAIGVIHRRGGADAAQDGLVGLPAKEVCRYLIRTLRHGPTSCIYWINLASHRWVFGG